RQQVRPATERISFTAWATCRNRATTRMRGLGSERWQSAGRLADATSWQANQWKEVTGMNEPTKAEVAAMMRFQSGDSMPFQPGDTVHVDGLSGAFVVLAF